MLEQILKTLIDEKKRQGLTNDFIRNILKEILQFYSLDFIYNSVYGKSLIFTGGSALRICYGLSRLSEDLDFDLEDDKKIDKELLVNDIINYFKKRLSFQKIEAIISGKEKKNLFKISNSL
jgi:predicted nucleotidyltransferase component of viral defense system